MENKKLDEKSLEELVKAANSFRDFMTNLADEISKVLADIKAHKEENTWEMKCPLKDGDEYWFINDFGSVRIDRWCGCETDMDKFNIGNAFQTEYEADLEANRRDLLTRFRAFRDECNDGWKPDWRKNDAKYYFYISSTDGEIGINDIYFYETVPLFGYFKNEKDAERAIELFGDEIKNLFVDCEGD